MAEMIIALKDKHISYEDLSRLVGKHMIDQAKINKAVADAAAVVEAKLATVEEGAQVNVIESVSVKDEAIVTKTNKALEIDLSAYAKKTDVAAGVNVKGSVDSYADLPAEGMTVGDMYNVKAKDAEHGVNAGDNVVWTGSEWDNFGHFVDMDGYFTKTEADNKFVAQETGKSLITDTEIARLAAMSNEANKTEATVVEFTNGTAVGSISIDGIRKTIKVPTVTVNTEYSEGVKLADIKIGDGEAITINMPADEFATTAEIDALYAELLAAAQAEANKTET